MDALREYMSHMGVVLTWENVYGSSSQFEDLRHDVHTFEPRALLRLVTHWNALVSSPDSLSIGVHQAIHELLHSPQQVIDMRRALERPDGIQADGVLNKHQLLILTRLALEECDWGTQSDGLRGPPLFELLLKINDHLAPTLTRDPRRQSRAKYESFATMFALHDLFHRRPAAGAIARTLEMLGQIHTDLAANAPHPVDIHGLFEQAAGLSISRFHTITLATYAVSAPERHGAPLHPNESRSTEVTPQSLKGQSAITAEEVEAYLATASLSRSEFKQRLASDQESPTALNFSVFRDRPLLEIDDEAYRVVDRDFLLNKLGDGIFWYLHRGAIGRKQINELRGWWGQLFEEYVHRLMEAFFPPSNGQYLRNPAFDDDTEEAADALLAIPGGLILFEFKASLVKKDARHSGRSLALARDVREKFAGKKQKRRRASGVAQIARALNQLMAPPNVRPMTIGPVKVKQARVIYPVLVCYDPGMSAPLMNCFLARELRRMLRFPTERVRPLTSITIEDLEELLPYAKNHGFKTILDTWHAFDPDMRTSFRLALHKRFVESERLENEWIRAKVRSWNEGMFAEFFPSSTSRRGEDPITP